MATAKLVNGAKMPIRYGQIDSVCGLNHAFVRVGIAAKASLAMAKVMAKFGS